MVHRAHAFSLLGLDAIPVEVEAYVKDEASSPSFTIVGLPDRAVQEARARVRSAAVNLGALVDQAIVGVNLAPAEVRKEGAGFDLPIALAVLSGLGLLEGGALERVAVVGELAFDGRVRPVPGTLAIAEAAVRSGRPRLLCPDESAAEAALVPGCEAVPCGTLREAVRVLAGAWPARDPKRPRPTNSESVPDLIDVRGQPTARRALEIAAAGGHNLLLVGPPGVGKTMLARRLPGLLPPLDDDAALLATRIHSAAGALDPSGGLLRVPPFRAPHHTATAAALVGGGSRIRPGEASLATGGVLFLDELPEFRRDALEALRTPLEDGAVRISRASGSLLLPASFALIAAMNPCPCGGGDVGACRCTAEQVRAYRRKASGPLLDRIDLGVRLERPDPRVLRADRPEGTAAVRERVLAARRRQHDRGALNARAAAPRPDEADALDDEAHEAVDRAAERLGLSPRAIHRVQRVARSIADLDDRDAVTAADVGEALALRLGAVA